MKRVLKKVLGFVAAIFALGLVALGVIKYLSVVCDGGVNC